MNGVAEKRNKALKGMVMSMFPIPPLTITLENILNPATYILNMVFNYFIGYHEKSIEIKYYVLSITYTITILFWFDLTKNLVGLVGNRYV